MFYINDLIFIYFFIILLLLLYSFVEVQMYIIFFMYFQQKKLNKNRIYVLPRIYIKIILFSENLIRKKACA